MPRAEARRKFRSLRGMWLSVSQCMTPKKCFKTSELITRVVGAGWAGRVFGRAEGRDCPVCIDGKEGAVSGDGDGCRDVRDLWF